MIISLQNVFACHIFFTRNQCNNVFTASNNSTHMFRLNPLTIYMDLSLNVMVMYNIRDKGGRFYSDFIAKKNIKPQHNSCIISFCCCAYWPIVTMKSYFSTLKRFQMGLSQLAPILIFNTTKLIGTTVCCA